MHSPVRTTKTILAFILSAVIFLDYWTYSQQFYREPLVYTDVLNGTAPAPNQYRIGIITAANFLARHAHLGLRHAMTLLDGLSAAVAVYLLYALLHRSQTYKASAIPMQWLASAAFVVLVQYDLVWLTWYQRPETLPTAALVALILWLLTPGTASQSRFSFVIPEGNLRLALTQSRANFVIPEGNLRLGPTQSRPPGLLNAGIMTGLLLITAAQSLIRADVAVALHLGVLLVCLLPTSESHQKNRFSLPRGLMIATSLFGVAIGGGIQLYLMRIAYPHAAYGATPVFQLALNITDRLRIIPFLIFLLPIVWTIAALIRTRHAPAGPLHLKLPQTLSGPFAAMLTGAVLFLIPWCVMGKIDEVRIFLPFALALAPLTAQLLIQRVTKFSQPDA